MSKETHSHEKVIRSGRANHFIDDVGMKGVMTLTADELCFVTHKMNFRQYELCMPLESIDSVALKYNLRIFPYGIVVALRNGDTHRFAVWGRKRWLKAISTEKTRISEKLDTTS